MTDDRPLNVRLVGYVNDRGTLCPLGNYYCMELSGPWYPVWRDLNGPAVIPGKVAEERI